MDLEHLAQHFWSKVYTTTPEECWVWLQSTGSHGYGQTWDGHATVLAHREAWALTHGEIPKGQTVDHICHNRVCCNPAHLRVLSNLENATDNRARFGVDYPLARLTPEIVREARRLRSEGWSYTELAVRYGVHRMTITPAIQGRTWKHV